MFLEKQILEDERSKSILLSLFAPSILNCKPTYIYYMFTAYQTKGYIKKKASAFQDLITAYNFTQPCEWAHILCDVSPF